MLTVKTVNSVYEFHDGKTRRVSGINPKTPRQAPDGEWQDYLFHTPPTIGDPMFICYQQSLGDVLNGTLTSPVESIEETEVIEWESRTPPPEEMTVTTFRLASVNDKVIPNEYSYEAIQ